MANNFFSKGSELLWDMFEDRILRLV